MELTNSNNILFKDENIVIVNKNSGIPVIPGRGDNKHCLRDEIENIFGKRIFVVHRIDKDTSGIVVFTLNSHTHKNLCEQFTKREIKKEYFAVVDGIPQEKERIIDAPIYQYGSGRMGVNQKGKESKTYYKVVEEYNNCALVKLMPHTGRRHQIRVHMYFIGHPILGDPLYGKKRPVGGVKRLMLHSYSIEFYYPDKKIFKIEAPFTEEWENIIKEIKNQRNSNSIENI
ncbi:MAG: RNA pseudouridine synthase [Chitinispirillaceae bacterium]|nr:RNA pseudouridine synthase [Chitinispirillaceae bacterium]